VWSGNWAFQRWNAAPEPESDLGVCGPQTRSDGGLLFPWRPLWATQVVIWSSIDVDPVERGRARAAHLTRGRVFDGAAAALLCYSRRHKHSGRPAATALSSDCRSGGGGAGSDHACQQSPPCVCQPPMWAECAPVKSTCLTSLRRRAPRQNVSGCTSSRETRLKTSSRLPSGSGPATLAAFGAISLTVPRRATPLQDSGSNGGLTPGLGWLLGRAT
jgi:hypothetical protein